MIVLNALVIVILAQILLTAAEPPVREYPSEIKECLEEVNVKIEDVIDPKKGNELNENQLCFLKCVMEKTGRLKSDGSVDFDNLDKCKIFSKMPEDAKKNAKDCLKEMPNVVECADMEKFVMCFGKIEL
nr:uncharacterized protein LOC111511668 [Leptinotarsa decemlineata]